MKNSLVFKRMNEIIPQDSLGNQIAAALFSQDIEKVLESNPTLILFVNKNTMTVGFLKKTKELEKLLK